MVCHVRNVCQLPFCYFCQWSGQPPVCLEKEGYSSLFWLNLANTSFGFNTIIIANYCCYGIYKSVTASRNQQAADLIDYLAQSAD